MSISVAVNNIFKKKTNYAEPDQVVDQAESLRYLSTDLYSDSKRFVYELLQNADDSSTGGNKVKVAARLFGNKMVIAHTGKPFDERDIRGVTGIGNGVKKDDPDKTGFKGIGFKAVFSQSDNVTIYTNGEYFRFDAGYQHSWNTDWAESQEVWEKSENRKYEVPWQIIPIYTQVEEIDSEIHEFLTTGGWQVATIVLLKNIDGTKAAINELAEKVNMYLFLKNIESIDFNTGIEQKISVDVTDDHCTVLNLNQQEKARWLKKTIILDIPLETQQKLEKDPDMPEKLKAAKKVEITLAAKMSTEGLETLKHHEQLIYAYLPTEESNYNLPVLVNAAFYMAANREELHKDSLWNKWLFSCIPTEIFKWIAELVQTNVRFTAYNLLPSKLTQTDKLAVAFNDSYSKGINDIPFILNSENELLKVKQSLIDNTFLSEKDFVGSALIRHFKVTADGLNDLSNKPFIPRSENEKKLKAIGVANFDWKDFPSLLKTTYFLSEHTIGQNKELILYLKNLHDNGYVTLITVDVLKSWSFIFNQNLALKSPKDVFFPAPDEEYAEDTDISFIHPELSTWAEVNSEIKLWLESLGVEEKSDLTYLKKSIIPYASTYSTLENAVTTVRNIFHQFQRGEVGQDLLKQLGNLQLLTKNGNLIPANQSYFSNEYQPYLKLESSLEQDIYVSPEYITSGNISEWKTFFYYFGVKERISLNSNGELLSNYELIKKGIKKTYLELHKFKPFVSTFTADSYRRVITLSFLDHSAANYEFSKLFWDDTIKGLLPPDLQKPARAYWGNSGHPGRTEGDDVPNYLNWYVANIECLPTTTNECLKSGQIFINGAEDTAMASKYLPVFEGPALSADWRSFFNFKPRLELADYLTLLTKIAEDPNESSNKARIQIIYSYLLDNLSTLDASQLSTIEAWASSAKIVDTENNYLPPTSLNFYADGDYSIFGGAFNFIQLNKANQKHADIEHLLELFKVTVLRQSEFGIIAPGKLPAIGLIRKLKDIIPYWAKWMENEAPSGYEQVFYELRSKFESIRFFKADDLTITYGEDWQKKVTVHSVDNELYTLDPWNDSRILYTLPAKLCEIFEAKKYDRELSFLLTSDLKDIIDFFNEESIGLPPEADTNTEEETSEQPEAPSPTMPEFNFSPPRKSYETLWAENLVRNTELIAASGNDPKALLLNGLKANNALEEIKIYHFSHLENALSIIREGAIKSRQSATFKDSAGSGIIAQTMVERKQYARFYFRTKTPTQYYVENLGRAADSIARIQSDPLCPVPVFFIFPLEAIIDTADWSVSIGSLASSQVDYGRSIEILSKFDFDGVYKQMNQLNPSRFLLAAHQEFLIKNELNIAEIPYQLGVQNEAAKKSLLAMLNYDQTWETRITVDPTLYHNENAKVKIAETPVVLQASLSQRHAGEFILQHSTDKEWYHIKGNATEQHNSQNWITTSIEQCVVFEGHLAATDYKLFYSYKGKNWLIHTNTQDFLFDYSFVGTAVTQWFEADSQSGQGIINALKQHPELRYWYEQPIPGPDNLTVESHTLAVIDNYEKNFNNQSLFESEKEYLLCLALHDIGKPAAILAGNKDLQHNYTLKILNEIRNLLPIDEKSFNAIQAIIDGDPIGKFLDSRYNITADESLCVFNAMAEKVTIDRAEFWKMIVVYYQCDAAGYNFLQKRLFLDNETESMELHADHSRFLFKNGYEEKYKELEDFIKTLG